MRRKGAWVSFGVALVASVLLAAAVFLPLWKPLFMAAVLAAVTHGPHERLSARLGGRPRLAATLLTIGVVVIVLLPVAVISAVVVRQAIEAVDFVRSALEEGGVPELIERLPDSVEGLLRDLRSALPVEPDALAEQAAGGGVTVALVLRDVVAAVSRILFSLAMMLIAYFALLTDGRRLLEWIEDVSPLHGRQTIELLDQFGLASRSVLRSVVLTGAAQAVAASVGYAIAGVPSVLFFGLLTFLASFVPSVGTALVAVPLCAFLFATGATWQGVFLLAWSFAVVGLVDNLLKPLLIRNGLHLHGVVIFFSLVGGLIVFGAIGLLVGPLAVTFLLTMVRFGQRDFTPHPELGARDESAEKEPPPALTRLDDAPSH